MKKLLTILALSLLLFEGILAYDALLNDGNAFSLLTGNRDDTRQIDIVRSEEIAHSDVAEPQVIITPSVVEQEADVTEPSPVALDETETVTTDQEQIHEGGLYEYYYSFLSDKEKKVYRVMVDAFTNFESGNAIETLDDDGMNKVAQAIRNDHPELFYIGEMGYTHFTLGGQIQSTALNVTYSDTEGAIKSKQGMIELKAQNIINGISPSASDYEKTKYVYETVINMTEYDTASVENQNISSVLINGRTVCAGYAKTVQYLLNMMGVETTLIEGVDLIKGEAHAWNLVKVDGRYYYIDATWGDTSYKNVKGTNVDGGINYGYLNITSAELLRNHSIKQGIVVPECNDTDANYFVREGLYFYAYDEAAIGQLFDNAYSLGASNVSFKCASLELFDEVKRKLVTDQKVFDYLRSSGSVSYSVDEDERTFCFWL